MSEIAWSRIPRPHRAFAAVLVWACGLASAQVTQAADLPPGLVSAPLSARSAPRGATLFAELPASQTGVVAPNAYADPRMWAERFHESGVGEIGTGVAIGDYDNDGLPDLFVVSKTETCRLFHNRGGWKFEDVTESAHIADFSGEWKQGASFVDVNNDGWLDVYVCRFGAPNLLFINQRDGTFREEAKARGVAVVDSSAMAAFADYDRDDRLDFYLHTNLLDGTAHPNGQSDYLFHNKGDGTFENVTAAAGIGGEAQGHSATWWDYDQDGWPDVYVANDFGVPDFLYRNNRNGTFTKVAGQVVPHTAGTAMGADLGDINNDGLMDFIVADMATTTHEKDQRGMADTRGMSRDFDNADPNVAPQIQRNAVYLNTGTGRMLEAGYLTGLAATDWTWSVRFEDLDNDGRLDLHVTNGMDREQTNVDLLLGMMRAESAQERVRIMKTSPVLAEANLAYRNLGDLRFQEVGAAWGLNQQGVSFGAAFGDLDGDGDLDLVFTNYQKGVTLLRNDSDTGHRILVALRGTSSNRFGIGATVRIKSAAGEQVRQLATARGYLSTSEPIVHFGFGEDSRIERLEVAWPSGRVQHFENLAVDQRYTITEPANDVPAPAASAPAVTLFTESGAALGLDVARREEKLEGTVPQPGLPFRFNRRGPPLAVGDIDGDGRDEIVIGGTTQDARQLFRRNGTRFESVALPALAAKPALNDGPLLLLDAQGAGRNDLLVTVGGAALPAEEPEYEATLYANGGGWQKTPATTLPSLPASVGAAVAADFDHDGRVDVFVGARVTPGFFPEIPHSALWAQRQGKWQDVTTQVAPELATIGMVTSALWSDVDGDGWIDLLLTLDWGGVRAFRNVNGRKFEDRSEAWGFAAAGTGLWTSLASADFNGDGRPDYAVGNVGLNTPWQPSTDRPELLLAIEQGRSGTSALIPAHRDGKRLVTSTSRRELGLIFPDVLKRFPKNDTFARSSLEEILGPDRLAAAKQLLLTEARSGVFLSQPDGTYRFEPLPRVAQIAPLQGLVAGDFDGDGRADLLAVQNSFAPSAPFGRFDGGLGQLLLGQGDGKFLPAPARASGFLVPGDAKALVRFDANDDGWPDVLVSRNNAASLAFVNHGVAGRRMFAVRLRGLPGNVAALGARVTAVFADGRKQVAEIAGGGGFSSQSSAAVFFGGEKSAPPVRLEVRWPDGRTTEQSVEPDAAVYTLAQPPR